MANWSFKREESSFKPLDVGDYRIRISSAELTQSKNTGNDMLALQFEVSGSNVILYHYIVFLNDRPEITNRMLTQFFDSFGILDDNFSLQSWVGKVGACRVKHEEYNGDMQARLHYFIDKKRQDKLPAWKSVDGADAGGFKPMDLADSSGDLPF